MQAGSNWKLLEVVIQVALGQPPPQVLMAYMLINVAVRVKHLDAEGKRSDV